MGDHDAVPEDRHAERMADAARDMQGAQGADDTFAMAANLAVVNVDGCDSASLSIVVRGSAVETRGATDDAVRLADRLQIELGEGPSLEAVWNDPVVHSPSMAYDPRWSTWGPQVAERTGLQSVLTFRLFTHGANLGALCLYSEQRDGFTVIDQADGLEIAAQIAVAVAATMKEANLSQALATRTATGQATGILMERYGLTAAAAFATMARVSSAEQVKLRDVALSVVEGRPLPGLGRLDARA